jgi:hypothetical protein
MHYRLAKVFGASVLGGCLTLAAAGTCRAQQCEGDCDGNGIVTINEVITSVNILLGNTPLTACPNADSDGDGAGQVTVPDVTYAVVHLLQGCAVNGGG